MEEMTNVEIIDDLQGLLRLEPLWNELVQESAIDHPFVTHPWVRCWWLSYGAGGRLHVIVVRRGREVLAIAPLMWSRKRMYGMSLRRLGSLYNFHTQRVDFIVPRRPAEAYRGIRRSLWERKDQWDVLELCQLAEGSGALEGMQPPAAENGFLAGVWASASSPYVSLRGRWEEYFGSLDRKHRSNLRNRMARLGRLGEVEVEVVSGGEGMAQALEEGFRLEAARWKGSRGTAILSRPEDRQFYTLLAHDAARAGWLELRFLKVGGRRIAFGYHLRYRNKLYLLKPGFDPEYAPYSPSNLLCYLTLRDAFERGLDEFDFLGEPDPWKLEWTRRQRPHRWLFVFPDSPRSRLLSYAKFTLLPGLKEGRLSQAARELVSSLRRSRRCAFPPGRG